MLLTTRAAAAAGGRRQRQAAAAAVASGGGGRRRGAPHAQHEVVVADFEAGLGEAGVLWEARHDVLLVGQDVGALGLEELALRAEGAGGAGAPGRAGGLGGDGRVRPRPACGGRRSGW